MRLRADALSRAPDDGEPRPAAEARPSPGKARALDGAAIVALLGLVALLYQAARHLWWVSDDFFNLLWVRAWHPSQYCLEPAVWQQLPFRMLTPLVFVSYDADLALFGMSPVAFHLHELASVALLGLALFVFFRLWLPTLWCFAAAALLVSGVPVAVAVAPHLMGRHYAESLALALASTVAWVLALRAGSRAHAWTLSILAAALWFAAAISKEIAIPLLAMLPLVPELRSRAPLETRARLLAPHAVAAIVYLGYRRYLMGAWIGGYGWVVEDRAWWSLATRLPWRLMRAMAGGSIAGWFATLLILAGALAFAASGRRRAVSVAVGALAVLAPLLPVATEVVPRYAVAPWLAAVVAFTFGARRWRGGATLMAVSLLATLVANRRAWAEEIARAQRESAENRAIVSLGPADVLRLPHGPPASLGEAHRFAAEVDHHASGGWYLDEIFLCLDHRVGRLWQYDDAARRVVDVSERLPAIRRAHCGSIRPRRPLSADITFDQDAVLHWKLGPYERGRWSFVLRDGVDAYPVPRSGAFQLAPLGNFPLRVRYDSPAGWVTYSPPLPLELASPRRWTWSRPTTPARGSS
jgi:hypothetical protein